MGGKKGEIDGVKQGRESVGFGSMNLCISRWGIGSKIRDFDNILKW